ncbi:hypothetical protein JK635_07415 [Neobacillus sp. YIM B02564]|uniref:Uncharacterized protein n=1 Tax=Neobacillus paridis TaxID=2803862 RepID=A0ABS1TL84_9BACI|nr:hypothetical protein [Neobacillus paridis]MBL4952037.1 hypothetical protein [Neobacillus paridis]
MFEALPFEIGGFSRADYNTEVNYEDPEVLLEFIEYSVVLPVVGYRKGTVVFAVEFNQTQFVLKKIENKIEGLEEIILATFPAAKLKDALHHLVHVVTDTEICA